MSSLGGIKGFESKAYPVSRKINTEGAQPSFSGGSTEATTAARRSGSSNLIFTLTAAAVLGAGLYFTKGKLTEGLSSVRSFFSNGLSTVKGFFSEGRVGAFFGDFFKNNAVGRYLSGLGERSLNALKTVRGWFPSFGKGAGEAAANAATLGKAPAAIIVPAKPPIEQVLGKAGQLASQVEGTTTASGLFIPNGPSEAVEKLMAAGAQHLAG